MADESGFSGHYYKSSDGLQLFYRDYPSRSDIESTPLVCLPGLTRNCRDFSYLAEWISEKRRVIAPDFRGRGNSEYDTEWQNYHPGQYVADVWTLLDELQISRLAVIGTSLGGWMATIMAHERPQALAGVIMNDIGPEVNPLGLERIKETVGKLPPVATLDEAISQTKLTYEVAFPGLSESKWRWFAENTYKKSENGNLDLNYDRNIGVATREGVSGLRHDPWMLFDAMNEIPLLILRGEFSDILSRETIRKMRSRNKNIKAVTISNRGHAPMLDETESTDAIANFLASDLR